MSAYVVADSTMNRVVSAIVSQAAGYDGGPLQWFLTVKPYALGGGTKVGKLLYEANTLAVNEQEPPPDFKWRNMGWGNDLGVLCQQLKSMECLKYQMAEGDVYEGEVYNALDAAVTEQRRLIVNTLPEYDDAKWG